jgi:hypothetical protein
MLLHFILGTKFRSVTCGRVAPALSPRVYLAVMDDRNAEREANEPHIAHSAKPGRIIVLGAVAMAFGAMMTVQLLGAYATLAGQSPDLDTPDLMRLRAPEMQWKMWITFVESAFLFASGVGLVKLQRWARSLFLALGITRVCVLAWSAWNYGVADPAIVIVFSILKTVGIYGMGIWFLTRPGAAELFEPKAEPEATR